MSADKIGYIAGQSLWHVVPPSEPLAEVAELLHEHRAVIRWHVPPHARAAVGFAVGPHCSKLPAALSVCTDSVTASIGVPAGGVVSVTADTYSILTMVEKLAREHKERARVRWYQVGWARLEDIAQLAIETYDNQYAQGWL